MNVLLDTATWINAVKEPETLPVRILKILTDGTNSFWLSDISLLEASMLVRKGRVHLGMPFNQWLERAIASNLLVLPISSTVAAVEHSLPGTFHGDPADRVIAATAIAHELTLITPDPQIAFRRVCNTMRYKWRTSRKGK